MITDAVLDFISWFGQLLLDTVPHVAVPDWLTSGGSIAGTVFGFAASMGVWYPAPLALTILGALLATWLIAFGIKLVRIVASFLTLGGGSAA